MRCELYGGEGKTMKSSRMTWSTTVLALSLIVGACTTSSSPQPGSPQPGSPQPGSPQPGQSASATADVTFTWAYSRDLPPTLEPTTTGGVSLPFAATFGAKLWDYDLASVPDGGCDPLVGIDQMTGELVDTWTTSADGRVITATLKEATSPFGNELTADDVWWTAERNSQLPADFYENTHGFFGHHRMPNPIDVIDEKTFTVTLDGPPTVFSIAAWQLFQDQILDSKEVQKHTTPDDPWATEWLANNVASYGPWQLESWDPGNQLVLIPNEGWPGERGNITRFIIKAVPDSTTRAQLIESGEADFAGDLTFAQFESLRNASSVNLISCEGLSTDVITFNVLTAKPEGNPASLSPIQDVRVRQAISKAIDRTALVNSVYLGFGTPSEGIWQENGIQSTETYDYDLENAKQLLADAGYPDGLTLTMLYADQAAYFDDLAAQVQDMLAQAGITVELTKATTTAELYERLGERNYEIALVQSVGRILNDAVRSTVELYCDGNPDGSCKTAEAGRKLHLYNNPEYDALFRQVEAMQAGPERDDLLTQMVDIAMTDQVKVPLVNLRFVQATGPGVSGFQNVPTGWLRSYPLSKDPGS
jgi:peptide/nickel transport system substrate-binding protein